MTSSGTTSFNLSNASIAVAAYSRISARKSAVYVARNLANGKCYIGVTSRGLEKRKTEHIRAADKGSHLPFHRALRKYGVEMFVFSEISSHDCHRAALNAEVSEIANNRPEYNVTGGGQGLIGFSHSEATKKKMSIKAKGRPNKLKGVHISAETIAKIKETKSKMTHSRPWLGRKHTEESIQKMKRSKSGITPYQSEALKMAGKNNIKIAQAARSKAVRCLGDGRCFPSGRAADEYYDLTYGTAWRIAKKNRNPSNGLDFEFLGSTL